MRAGERIDVPVRIDDGELQRHRRARQHGIGIVYGDRRRHDRSDADRARERDGGGDERGRGDLHVHRIGDHTPTGSRDDVCTRQRIDLPVRSDDRELHGDGRARQSHDEVVQSRSPTRPSRSSVQPAMSKRRRCRCAFTHRVRNRPMVHSRRRARRQRLDPLAPRRRRARRRRSCNAGTGFPVTVTDTTSPVLHLPLNPHVERPAPTARSHLQDATDLVDGPWQ